ncbi:hypothetical protein CBL_10985 [Carabus blaptoides fortunei]
MNSEFAGQRHQFNIVRSVTAFQKPKTDVTLNQCGADRDGRRVKNTISVRNNDGRSYYFYSLEVLSLWRWPPRRLRRCGTGEESEPSWDFSKSFSTQRMSRRADRSGIKRMDGKVKVLATYFFVRHRESSVFFLAFFTDGQ